VKDVMAYPQLNLGTLPKDQRYRFNWNNPVVASPQNPKVLYHGANVVLRTEDEGQSWQVISPDLTRNDTTKHGLGGEPFTNEAAGGEVYNTLSYIACSPHSADVIWTGSDCGLVHLTQDGGKNWSNVTPAGLPESLINAIEVSPHDAGTAYLAVTRYKFDDRSPMIFVTHDFGKTWRKIVNGLPADNFVRVVREDPKQKGLLYAGTENGLFLSFNGGENWRLFKSNLPAVPLTDLAVHDNDLLVSTAGRAFWILDDLGALQQTMGKPDTTTLAIFAPKPTVKFTLEANPEPSPYEGQNPRSGITFDYFLPHNWLDSNSLTLQVLDMKGEVIRTISNQKPTNFKGWQGGPPPPQALPAKPGLNRFNWDLRYETLPGVEGVFVMGDYRGRLAAPGSYTLRLLTKTDTVETRAQLLPDPRLKASHADFEEQRSLLEHVENTVGDIHQAVGRLRNVKQQLEQRLDLLKKSGGQDDLVKTGEAVLKAITAWEEQLVQPKQKTFQDVINFRNRLNAEFLNVKTALDTHTPQPTQGVKQRLHDLLAEWNRWKTEMERLISAEVGGFNAAYAKAGLPALILPKE
jgi:hypothetical protein